MSKFTEVPSVDNRSFRTQVDLYAVDLGTVNPFISSPFEGGLLIEMGDLFERSGRGGGAYLI